MSELKLEHGLTFEDLYEGEGLARIDALFCQYLGEADAALCQRLVRARRDHETLAKKEESQLLLDIAPHLEDFISGLFGIRREAAALAARHDELAPIYACKRQFVQKRCKKIPASIVDGVDGEALAAELAALFDETFSEAAFARHVLVWLDDAGTHEAGLEKASHYAAWAMRHDGGLLFRQPEKTDPYHLVPVETIDIGTAAMRLPDEHHRHREGFALTDAGTDLAGALDQANYCIWCHNQGRDSCSTGLKNKKTGAFQTSAFDVTLTGCPLEEKISEMNLLATEGHTVGALAMACVDNPLVAATGHRICNECMKACIYQKQEPVNIPQIETRMLKDVLQLPWGFEIYGLMTRWNPLNLGRPLPKLDSGYKVLIAGLGPAGFTLAHHLMNDGCTVVGVDGLKIEPLLADISGVAMSGERIAFRPIRDIRELYEALDERVMAGFGGVTEYGITVRWDKNFLKVIRLLLERRARFSMIGGVRFGGTFTVDDAYDMGFDHVALCMGAGAPTVISIPNGMARGVRQASDFLMALQLTGAARRDSVANLQIRLPVVVIGGGLTAIDTATESLAYYPVQVEKFLGRFETLAAERGEEAVRASWGEEESVIADEFLAHARAIRLEREQARAEGREPDILGLLNQWGGSTIAYRRRLIDSPSYTLNHEEVHKALEEGICFAELLGPAAIDVDQYGHAEAIRLIRRAVDEDGRIVDTDAEVTLPARSVLVAAGTKPNVVLNLEDPANLKLDGKYFQAVDESGEAVKPEWVAKPGVAQVLTNIRPDGRSMSFFGDLHPSFAGNVVKAMASATQGYPVIGRMLEKCKPTNVGADALVSKLAGELHATVHRVERLTHNIVEVVVRAPRAARAFQPGQFYRLQNYEANAKHVSGTLLAMEGVALTGASVDLVKGLISLILLEMGGSSDLCAQMKPGEPVVLMGPTGHPTEITSGENVLLIGGGLGNAVLFSIGSAFKAAGSKVLYFAGYKKIVDRYKVPEIEAAADEIVWCCDEAPGFEPGRAQDKAFVGNMLEALLSYGNGDLGQAEIPLNKIDRIIVIGSAGLMSVIADARHGVLKDCLKPDHIGIGSINSPMQCMMKKICAQCLQPHKDAKTGKEKGVVFSCFNQDQLLDEVDFPALMQRLQQQSVQEKLTRQWIDHCLVQLGLRNNRLDA